LAKRLPRYPVPAAGLGRLAVVISDVVGEAEHARKFLAGFLIEIRVAHSGVDCPMADADIRQASGVIGSDGGVPVMEVM
jgi:hypothetical protein